MGTNATSLAKLSALPDPWIERIFSKMASNYGSLFLDRWRDCDLVQVKADWAEDLANFSDAPECFGKALKAMTDECRFPPTLPEFVALCRRYYSAPQPVAVTALSEKLSPEQIQRNRDRLRDMAQSLAREKAMR